jgi:hypothetical protein
LEGRKPRAAGLARHPGSGAGCEPEGDHPAQGRLDREKLRLAADYSRSFTAPSKVLVIRNGYVPDDG